mgnify:FL=1
MSSQYYNPDYPTLEDGGFLNSYRTPVQNTYFYGGTQPAWNPFNQGDPTSRRNMPYPTTPMTGGVPFGGTPYPTQNPYQQQQVPQQGTTVIPEQNVQPFSTYPPAKQMNPNDLNAFIESRRNIPSPQTNPWATPQTVNPSPQAYCTPDPYHTPWEAPFMGTYGTMKDGMTVQPIDRKNLWGDNPFSQPSPVAPPQIDWTAAMKNATNTAPMFNNAYGYSYPAQNQNVNWFDAVQRNFAK